MMLVEEVKKRLGLTGTFHDELIGALIEDVKVFMLDGGVAEALLNSDKAVGCISRGVADLWNYGSGDGRFSEVFFQRMIQLDLLSNDGVIIERLSAITTSEIDECTERLRD